MNRIDNALYFSNDYDRRQIKTKKAIISAFMTLLQEKNMSKISITELARLADSSRFIVTTRYLRCIKTKGRMMDTRKTK